MPSSILSITQSYKPTQNMYLFVYIYISLCAYIIYIYSIYKYTAYKKSRNYIITKFKVTQSFAILA